jgi:hypothetical protein
MNLPTQLQVNAATRHAASFAAGAIAMFGLSTKIDPQTAVAIINSGGALVNDGVLFIGLVTPFVTSWRASRSASTPSQTAAVQANPKAQVITTDPDLAKAVPGVKLVAQL